MSTENSHLNVQRNTDARIMYKKRGTVLKTLKDRGYAIPVGEEKLSFQDFLELYQNEQHHLYLNTSPPNMPEKDKKGGGVYVYFEKSEDFTKKMLESHVANIDTDYPNLDKLFFVLNTGKSKKKSKVNIFVQNAVEKKEEYKHVEILSNVYPFDLTDNYLVPKHTLINDQEQIKALITKYGSLNYLPRIPANDPIVKRYGAKRGDIFLIERRGGRDSYYRMVGIGTI